MTTFPPGRTLPQPLPKTSSTVQSSRLAAIADNVSRPASRAQSRVRLTRARQDAPVADHTSPAATLALIRRTLLSDQSMSPDTRTSSKTIEDVLPPLTSSNDVDIQLYAIIAIIIKDFVNTWYTNITPDHQFVEEIVHIIAHCSRALEQRIRHTDMVELMLSEIPYLFERHVLAYRAAMTASIEHPYGKDLRSSYHTLNPHPALDPLPNGSNSQTAIEQQQQQNETTYRQLMVKGALAVLLPTEDLQNSPLRLLMGDILADLIIGQALAGKVCEGWFLHAAIIKTVTVIKDRLEPKATGQGLRQEAKNRLEQFGLLNSEENDKNARSARMDQSIVSIWFWQILQGIFFVYLALRFVIRGVNRARSLPSRSSGHPLLDSSSETYGAAHDDQSAGATCQATLDYGLYGMIATTIRFHDRMPWLASAFNFIQHALLSGPGRLAAPGSIFDTFLHDTIQTHILPPGLVAPILLNLRATIFPNNSLGPPAPPPPTKEEAIIIRRRAAESLLSLIPLPIVFRTYFGTEDEEEILRYMEEEILDVLGDAYLNKHLVYGILEAVLCRLVPELVKRTTSELLAERGVGIDQITQRTRRRQYEQPDTRNKEDRVSDRSVFNK